MTKKGGRGKPDAITTAVDAVRAAARVLDAATEKRNRFDDLARQAAEDLNAAHETFNRARGALLAAAIPTPARTRLHG